VRKEEALRERIALPALLAMLALLAGCASPASLHFRCEPQINEGLLLTVDLIQVNDAEAPQVRQAGDQWFYSDLRRQLEPRTHTVAVQGGCDTTVQIPPRKGYDTLAIVADFKSGSGAGGNLQFRSKKDWDGKKLLLRVQGNALIVQEGK
jgi:hypothetical protein